MLYLEYTSNVTCMVNISAPIPLWIDRLIFHCIQGSTLYVCVLSVQIQSYNPVIKKSLLGLRKFFNTTQWSRNKKYIGRQTTHQATNSMNKDFFSLFLTDLLHVCLFSFLSCVPFSLFTLLFLISHLSPL